MPLQIIKPGLRDVIQDHGRFGYSEFGINPGGVMDRFAARLANSLVGNSVEKPVLEIHFPGPQLLFTEDALISITGADFSATINDEPFPLWHPVIVRKNTLLQFKARRSGARAYLATHAGFYTDKWLASAATNIKALAGGWRGRKLEKGDEIPFGFHTLNFTSFFKTEKNFRVLPWSPDVQDVYTPETTIFFLAGKEWDCLQADSQRQLEAVPYNISAHSDSMGYQLSGVALSLQQRLQCITSPVSFGTMQLLPGGQLIILMADHQTTGGYPRIGHVISAHLPKLAQLSAGESIHFTQVDLLTAEALFLYQLKELDNLHALCMEHLNDLLCAR
jgi:antagonist of KipI